MQEPLLAWYSQNRRALPWRETRDPYAILVSEVMLQQTQVARVAPRYLAWLERWPSEDRRSRIVFITRRIPRGWVEALLDALDAEVGEVEAEHQ